MNKRTGKEMDVRISKDELADDCGARVVVVVVAVVVAVVVVACVVVVVVFVVVVVVVVEDVEDVVDGEPGVVVLAGAEEVVEVVTTWSADEVVEDVGFRTRGVAPEVEVVVVEEGAAVVVVSEELSSSSSVSS